MQGFALAAGRRLAYFIRPHTTQTFRTESQT